jgi:hypothetical protein
VTLDLRDRRADSIALFGDLDEPARDQLAHDAWAPYPTPTRRPRSRS